MLGHPFLVLLTLDLCARVLATCARGLKVLSGNRFVDLLLLDLLQLLQRLVFDGLAHAHHGRVPAKVGDVRAGIALEAVGDGVEVDIVLHFELAHIDFQKAFASRRRWQRNVDSLFKPKSNRKISSIINRRRAN